MAAGLVIFVCFSADVFLLKVCLRLIDLDIFTLLILFNGVFGVYVYKFLLRRESIGFSKLRLDNFALSDRDGGLVHFGDNPAN
jgi:hypothetical protein